jgi:hypothetical protein
MQTLKKLLVALPGLAMTVFVALASVGPADVRQNLRGWATLGRLSLPPASVITGLAAVVAVAYVVGFLVWRRHARAYLSSTRPTLSDAVESMAFRSAWGKEFRARQLMTTGQLNDGELMQQAAALVTRALRAKPDLIVEGAASLGTGFRSIPQAIWQSLDLLPILDQDGKWFIEPVPVPGANAYALRDVLSLSHRRINAKPFLEEYPEHHSLADQGRRQALAAAQASGVHHSLISHVLHGSSPTAVRQGAQRLRFPTTSAS